MKIETRKKLHPTMEPMSYENLLKAPTTELMNALASDKSLKERFYLTGYEGLCLGMSHETLTEAVISSVVPMGREMLLVGDSEACTLWRKVCHKLSIKVTVLDAAKEDLGEAVETILKANTQISNIMCSTKSGADVLRTLGRLARKSRKQFVVDNSDDTLTLADIDESGVDFAISGSEGKDAISMIVARRSRLVMAEGNARSAKHDIYAIWQDTLTSRNSRWMPMA